MPTFEELQLIFQEKQGNCTFYLMDAHRGAENGQEQPERQSVV